ncbi:MAG: GMC family oxidoreductase [Acidobacteria bacterium]|nr:MAG: GMC family oxidoreductase [Acidobacteriota bacterium]PYU49805.1 MAG: GMC family oxidoreductase [Acidobacteriota bacterium]PYU76036.1 MAG: GMC family oxidoreductase [Acidobacteriota bacterium]
MGVVEGDTLSQTPTYDACIIGSGAAGGVVAKELCEGGAKVIMLEAGREVPPGKFLSHKWPYELPYRGLRGEKQAPFYQGGVSTSIRYEDCDSVSVDRIRVLGGRTVHWNAVVLRYAQRDFKGWSADGIEEDWPLTYDELEPYYERIEQMIGVCGQDDGLEIVPAGKHYLPPLPWRCSEHILHRATNGMGIPLISVRKAVLTTVYDSRPPCHYCGHCMSGCDVGALFNSAVAMLPKAQRTGNFTLRQNALAREILVDREGLARGVSFVDTQAKREQEVKARVVVVCCATVESARLLLNSRSPRHPNGLANSNGVVGRYLHGHLGGGVDIFLKELEGAPPFNQDGATDHVYIPRYNHLAGEKDYAGGWGLQVNFSSYMFPNHASRIGGYGVAYKERVRKMQPGYLMLGAFGKTEARPENYVTVEPHQVDENGISIPVVHFRFSENDFALWRDKNRSLMEICSNLKGEVFPDFGEAPGGFASHEVGTIRMGKNPRTSVLNGFCQAREVKNLFVTDGSCFTSSSEKNPTLTIMALSLRAADYIKEQRRRGEL